MAYGILILLCGAAALGLTTWAVERLDDRPAGARHVAWRPWYRTAIACGYYVVIGASPSSQFAIDGRLWLEFFSLSGLLVLLACQLLTRSAIRLQALEAFGVCLAFVVGAQIPATLGLSAGDSLRARVREANLEAALTFAVWFTILTTIAALGTLLVRAVAWAFRWTLAQRG